MEPRINFEMPYLILQKIGIIDSFDGEWNAITESGTPKLERLKKRATIESIGASIRFEELAFFNTTVPSNVEKEMNELLN